MLVPLKTQLFRKDFFFTLIYNPTLITLRCINCQGAVPENSMMSQPTLLMHVMFSAKQPHTSETTAYNKCKLPCCVRPNESGEFILSFHQNVNVMLHRRDRWGRAVMPVPVLVPAFNIVTLFVFFTRGSVVEHHAQSHGVCCCSRLLPWYVITPPTTRLTYEGKSCFQWPLSKCGLWDSEDWSWALEECLEGHCKLSVHITLPALHPDLNISHSQCKEIVQPFFAPDNQTVLVFVWLAAVSWFELNLLFLKQIWKENM